MEAMMPYIYCLIVTLAQVATCAFLGWCTLQGASLWLIVVMLGIGCATVIPARDIFTCPKCGWIGEVKTYKALKGEITVVQKEPVADHD
ncbi:MAG: hypothetical protein K6F46_09995 [Desulfovibrio sp.]|nr:hypothetical protein [Desulfovibrio sp.]